VRVLTSSEEPVSVHILLALAAGARAGGDGQLFPMSFVANVFVEQGDSGGVARLAVNDDKDARHILSAIRSRNVRIAR